MVNEVWEWAHGHGMRCLISHIATGGVSLIECWNALLKAQGIISKATPWKGSAILQNIVYSLNLRPLYGGVPPVGRTDGREPRGGSSSGPTNHQSKDLLEDSVHPTPIPLESAGSHFLNLIWIWSVYYESSVALFFFSIGLDWNLLFY